MVLEDFQKCIKIKLEITIVLKTVRMEAALKGFHTEEDPQCNTLLNNMVKIQSWLWESLTTNHHSFPRLIWIRLICKAQTLKCTNQWCRVVIKCHWSLHNTLKIIWAQTQINSIIILEAMRCITRTKSPKLVLTTVTQSWTRLLIKLKEDICNSRNMFQVFLWEAPTLKKFNSSIIAHQRIPLRTMVWTTISSQQCISQLCHKLKHSLPHNISSPNQFRPRLNL